MEYEYTVVYHSRIGWWEDVCEIYKTRVEAENEFRTAKECDRIKSEYESITIETNDGKEMARAEL